MKTKTKKTHTSELEMSSRVAEAERYLQIDRVNMFIFPLA